MTPYHKDITIRRGDTKTIFFRIRERTWNGTEWVAGAYRDLTGWTAKSEIRPDADSNTVLATFTPTLSDQSTVPGGVTLKLSAATTAALNFTTPAVWDVQLTDGSGNVHTYMEGTVTLTKDVTK